jgi:hypothetical protein
VRTCDGVAYDFDLGAVRSVNVAALHGQVESSAYTTISVLPGGRLEAFDIQQDEIDRLEDILNDPRC